MKKKKVLRFAWCFPFVLVFGSFWLTLFHGRHTRTKERTLVIKSLWSRKEVGRTKKNTMENRWDEGLVQEKKGKEKKGREGATFYSELRGARSRTIKEREARGGGVGFLILVAAPGAFSLGILAFSVESEGAP